MRSVEGGRGIGACAGRSSGRTCRYARLGGVSLSCIDTVFAAARVRKGTPSVTLARNARVGELPCTTRAVGMRGADAFMLPAESVTSTARGVAATDLGPIGARAERLGRTGFVAGIGESHVRVVSRDMDIEIGFSFRDEGDGKHTAGGVSAWIGLQDSRPMDVIGRSRTWPAHFASDVAGRCMTASSDAFRLIFGVFLAASVLGASARRGVVAALGA